MMEHRRVLPVLLGEFRDRLSAVKELNPRDAKFPNAPNKVKVAIGMRRTGKTTFLFQKIYEYVRAGIPIESILYLNFEDDRLFPLDEKIIGQFVDEFYSLYPENHDRKCFFFFDEIQNVPDWTLVVRRLHDTKNAEIFLTGSSAKLLSKEIATSLRGRSLAVEIWPYSFDEFLRAKKIEIDRSLFDSRTRDHLRKQFSLYMSEGGFPEVIDYDWDTKHLTLQDYLDVVVYRDIIERHRIKHPRVIKRMILSMMHNVGKPFSVNKFYRECGSQNLQVGKDQLYEYAEYVEDAYLAFSVPSYSSSYRKSQTVPKKCYAIDPGLVRSLTLDYENDLSRLFENVIYLDLRRLGYKVSYYISGEGYEVDFVAETPRGQKKLIQICWDTQDKETMAREERGLEAGMKELNADGQILTLDEYLSKPLE